jgi:hypothetical protein
LKVQALEQALERAQAPRPELLLMQARLLAPVLTLAQLLGPMLALALKLIHL